MLLPSAWSCSLVSGEFLAKADPLSDCYQYVVYRTQTAANDPFQRSDGQALSPREKHRAQALILKEWRDRSLGYRLVDWRRGMPTWVGESAIWCFLKNAIWRKCQRWQIRQIGWNFLLRGYLIFQMCKKAGYALSRSQGSLCCLNTGREELDNAVWDQLNTIAVIDHNPQG